jgi:alkylation response protein AidB-like acyl-CoA dehydrogenase
LLLFCPDIPDLSRRLSQNAPGLTIIDDWSGFGQRTTASGKVLIDNVRLGAEAIIPAYLGVENPSSNGSISQLIQAAVDAGIARGAIEETISFVRNHARPWLDSGQEHGYEEVLTISQIGDLEVRLHAKRIYHAEISRGSVRLREIYFMISALREPYFPACK